MAYLPPDQAVVGNGLAVSYMEELYPVTVRSADATPLFDPDQRAAQALTMTRTSWCASSGCPTPRAR